MQIDHSLDGMHRELARFLSACAEDGFQLPLHVAAVAVNGAAHIYRYVEGEEHLECKLLAQHSEGGVMRLPINIMITDASGKAALFGISAYPVQ